MRWVDTIREKQERFINFVKHKGYRVKESMRSEDRQTRNESGICLCGLGLLLVLLLFFHVSRFTSHAQASEPLIIVASPSVRVPLEGLAHKFEVTHPAVSVQLSFERGLDLRWTIAQVENQGLLAAEPRPIHLVTSGDDELVTRLAQKQYVWPETRTPYAMRPLVLVVPESLVNAPTAFASLAQDSRWRIAVADPLMTELGLETAACLESLGIAGDLAERREVAVDARGVLDRVLRGDADMGILFGPDALQEQEHIRIAAVAPAAHHRPRVYSMAMMRSCPERRLCGEFLSFLHTAQARDTLKQLGYGIPPPSHHE